MHHQCYHSVQRKIKKDKIQRWWNLTPGNLFTISRLKMQHWRGWFEASLTFFWNRGLATILAVLPYDEHSRSLFGNSGPIFLLRYVSVLFLYWTSSHSHHRECYRHGHYFFGFGFLETRSCYPFKYPLVIFKCTKFIRNLRHGVRNFVTFIKTYLE